MDSPQSHDKSNMAVTFRRATQADVDELCAMVRAAVAGMLAHGIDQWDEAYPSRADILCDAQERTLFVGETIAGGKTRCAVMYTLNQKSDPEYDGARWRFCGEYRVLHRLCVHPEFQHRGIATRALGHIEKEAAGLGANSIRFDVFSKNPFSLALYKNAGYTTAGAAVWRKGLFYLMEKNVAETTVGLY